jgi:hypothetical protein
MTAAPHPAMRDAPKCLFGDGDPRASGASRIQGRGWALALRTS